MRNKQVQFSNRNCESKNLGQTEGQTDTQTHSFVYRVANPTQLKRDQEIMSGILCLTWSFLNVVVVSQHFGSKADMI